MSASAAQARFDEGTKLITRTSLWADWQRGMALIEQASRDGVPEASERSAVFHCMGIGKPIDWPRALDLLVLAAEQGSARAAEELSLMAGGDRSSSPRDLRSAISLEQLFSAPPVQLLSMTPRIGIIKQFASPEECRWLIESARDRLEPATIFDPETGALRPDPNRTNRAVRCDPLESGLMVEVIRARLANAIGLPLTQFEVSQILHYAVGEQFWPHHDYFNTDRPSFQKEIAAGGQRIATQLIYLNEEYEGGATQFPDLGFEYRGGTGDSLMFFNINERGDAEPLTLHCGLPPTSGDKWTFSQWIRDRQPAPRS
ncbi:MAG: 2OG-Fe(II) oxygenase [Sphingomicrobium sp.]